jgi:uncharacterized protein YndB with AHSA1/START domain/predicted ester cyclase
MERAADSKHRIVVRRTMPAPREFVYNSWIDPEGLREWMCPGDILTAEATLDVRVGGSFRITMRSQDRVHEHVGTYQIVDPPAKLVFTWSGLENPAEITLVTVEFLARGEQSELVITHEGFTNPDVGRRYEMGWGTIAGKFAKHLGRNSREQRVTPDERNKNVIREFTRIFKNEHNVDGINHLFANDFTHHFRVPLPPGLEGFKQIGRVMNGAFPDVVVTEEDLIAGGDTVVERSSAVATHKGSLMGETPTHKRIQWTEIHIYRFEDGKIHEHWVEMATMELLQQIGALPQPVLAA